MGIGEAAAHGGLAALQLVKDLIHDVGLNQGLLLDEQVHRLGDLLRVSGVLGVAQVLQGDADGVPAVVEHQDLLYMLYKTTLQVFDLLH